MYFSVQILHNIILRYDVYIKYILLQQQTNGSCRPQREISRQDARRTASSSTARVSWSLAEW